MGLSQTAFSRLDTGAAPALRGAGRCCRVFSPRPPPPRRQHRGETRHQPVRAPSARGSGPAFGGRQEARARLRSQSRHVAGESRGAHRLRTRAGRGPGVTPPGARTGPPPLPRARRVPARTAGARRAPANPAALSGTGRPSADADGSRPDPGRSRPDPPSRRAHLRLRRPLWAHFRETRSCARLRGRGGAG